MQASMPNFIHGLAVIIPAEPIMGTMIAVCAK